MIQEIVLNNNKGIKKLKLSNLGKINVFVGRNNSGKTAILNAILEKHLIQAMEAMFNIGIYQELYASLDDKSKFDFEYFYQFMKSFEKYFKQNIGEFSFNRNRESEATFLIQRLKGFVGISNSKVRSDYLGKQTKFNTTLKNEFQKNNTVVFFDSKRALADEFSISNSFNYVDIINPKQLDGKEFLTYLHYGRNRKKSSSENKIFAFINDLFAEITQNAEFEMDLEEQNHNTKNIILYFKERYQDDSYPSKYCGTGYKEILLLLFAAANPKFKTVIIDEPENFLHPEFQRKLLAIFKDKSDKQYFIATHSSVLLDERYVDRIFQVNNSGEITAEEITSKAIVLNELGYSPIDNLTSDLIILCEGPSDKRVINEVLEKMELTDKYSVKYLFLGGDIMSQVDVDVVLQISKTIAIIDSDPGSRKERNRFKELCKENGIPCYQTKRYAIENYFTVEALREAFGSKIPSEIEEINPDEKLEKQIGINVKKGNQKIIKAMAIEDIKGTDIYEGFFLRVKELLER
ncbi:AAA family ATPase [bacterium]|nr:AAA family ATPase [bacterium]